MYFSFKESVSNARCFGVFSLSNMSRKGSAGIEGDCDEKLLTSPPKVTIIRKKTKAKCLSGCF